LRARQSGPEKVAQMGSRDALVLQIKKQIKLWIIQGNVPKLMIGMGYFDQEGIKAIL
jgi:hypothetical protein